MRDCVLDASAVLATVSDEPGGKEVEAWLKKACISAVNFSEVVTKLTERDVPAALIGDLLAEVDLDVRNFDRNLAEQAGFLRAVTRSHGLSFGDRACLALAAELGRPVITTDRAWAKLDIGIEVVLIR